MALPALYRNITLTSHSESFADGLPGGDGSWHASPFCTGLNALVTRKTATLVQSLHFQGDWLEQDRESNARFGRLSDSSVLLNIAVRAAVDRCINLQSFKFVKSPIHASDVSNVG